METRLKALSEQVIVITGASSGIGLVTARSAAAQGAKVLLVARDEDALRRAVGEIVRLGGNADFALADVGDSAQVEAAAAQAIARWGRIDTWVNDAGVGIVARLVDTPLAEHHRLFRTNYFGVVNGATAALAHLRAQGGALITVASVASDVPAPMLGAYAATQHAVRGFVETLRMECLADEALVSVAKRAIDRKTGARGLRSILESILLDTMFDLPGMEGVAEIMVDKDVVEGRKEPVRVFAKKGKEATGAA